MTLDEAIIHAEKEAEEQEKMGKRNYDDDCLECASEHRQLAEWLRELKAYRENDKEYLQTLRYADMPTLQSAT